MKSSGLSSMFKVHCPKTNHPWKNVHYNLDHCINNRNKKKNSKLWTVLLTPYTNISFEVVPQSARLSEKGQSKIWPCSKIVLGRMNLQSKRGNSHICSVFQIKNFQCFVEIASQNQLDQKEVSSPFWFWVMTCIGLSSVPVWTKGEVGAPWDDVLP